MLIYSNAFRCSVKDDNTEVIIQLLQETPKISDVGASVIGIQNETVASIAMPASVATALAGAILQSQQRSASAEEDDGR